VAAGELVFQTGMVGYQEALTDPSYAGQLLIFSYPLVGNYGVSAAANQSGRVHTRGAIVSNLMPSGGHIDADEDLEALLRLQGVPVVAGVDTRFLVRLVRTHGVLPAALAVGPAGHLPPPEDLLRLALSVDYDTTDFVAGCTTPELVWYPPSSPGGPRVVLVDYGAKQGILNCLLEKGAGVWLAPASMSTGDLLALRPDGILLSNGPGDPARLAYAVDTVRGLLQGANMPVFGICLGHQLLALAAGARTSKMPFGHRGVNQPVLELETGRVSITTQNHGYVVDPESIPPGYRVTHTNLNDGSVEGMAHLSKPIWGVQWHPEASPGPADTRVVIERFLSVACESAAGVAV
jgi:carbamoyl-phosphate synthase small subunit